MSRPVKIVGLTSRLSTLKLTSTRVPAVVAFPTSLWLSSVWTVITRRDSRALGLLGLDLLLVAHDEQGEGRGRGDDDEDEHQGADDLGETEGVRPHLALHGRQNAAGFLDMAYGVPVLRRRTPYPTQGGVKHPGRLTADEETQPTPSHPRADAGARAPAGRWGGRRDARDEPTRRARTLSPAMRSAAALPPTPALEHGRGPGGPRRATLTERPPPSQGGRRP